MESYIDAKIGMVKIFNQEDLKAIEKVETIIGNNILKPDDETNLNNFFNQKVTYLGLHDGFIQFKIGEDSNLFDNLIYTSSFKKISENRIMNIYKSGSARDYIFRNGIWK